MLFTFTSNFSQSLRIRENKKMNKLDIAFLELLLLCSEWKRQNRRIRRWKTRPLNRDRAIHGYFFKVFLKMKEFDEEQFFIHTRMTTTIYNMLLSFVEGQLCKAGQSICAEERLSITLLYLAHGSSFQTIAWSYKIGKTTVRNIVLETCMVIWDVLSPIYLSEPTKSQYGNIADGFAKMWDMPNCVGAIDGKHIAIVCPNKSGSMYFNYKKFYSIVLMAVCDSNYTFTSVDVGSYGSNSDGGILRHSRFGQNLISDQLPLPEDAPLCQQKEEKFPFFFVGDAAFPLRKNLMRPYPGANLNQTKDIFNYRLSRARRTIENSFGILAARWRVLRSVIECSPENTEGIVLACLVLHNFIMLNDTKRWYCPDGYADWENADHESQTGGWQAELSIEGGPLHSITTQYRNASMQSFQLRDKLADYFVKEGAVSFQYKN